MKKLIFSVVLVVMCVSMFAQFTPYGSVRANYWYNITDEDHQKGDRTEMDLGLQTNSRMGINWKGDGWNSKVEMGLDRDNRVSVRHAWVKRNYDGWALSFGQMEDGLNQLVDQTWSADKALIGYGIVYGNRNPQIRADFGPGLYASLIAPTRNRMPVGTANDIDFLIPKINLGWNGEAGKVALKPSVIFQMFSYNDDICGRDDTVTAFLGALTVDYKDNAFKSRLQASFGLNSGNMGFDGPRNVALWDAAEEEVSDTSTISLAAQVGFDLADDFYLGAGFGFAQSSNDLWDNDDARMGLFLQAVLTGGGFKFIPEVGLMDEMKDPLDNKEGSLLYFGTQLRFDF